MKTLKELELELQNDIEKFSLAILNGKYDLIEVTLQSLITQIRRVAITEAFNLFIKGGDANAKDS